MSQSEKSWDENWEAVFNSQAWGKYPALGVIKFVASNFYKKNRAEVKLLEVGCGTGANIWYMGREGFATYGIDGSKTAIELAQKRMEEELGQESNTHLVVGDIVHLPYESEFFDAVIDVECLYANNLHNSKKILAEIYRVLKPGGMLYSLTFSDEMSIGKTQTKIAPNEYKDISDGPLAEKGFVRLIDKNGIGELYGDKFALVSIDKFEHTINNQADTISEWSIVCKK